MKPADALSLSRTVTPPRVAPPVSFFEFWPDWLFYTPIVTYWIALGLRYGDFSLPTAANPAITLGGLCGESKREVLDQVRPPERDVLARYAWIARPDFSAALPAIDSAGLAYPLVAKPDIGCNGTGVRLIVDQHALAGYLEEFPQDAAVLFQEYVDAPGEAGLFYVRHPDAARGRITSVTLKESPFVVGDGRSTLRQLILADPRAGRVPHLYLPRLADRLEEVPPQGEPVRLVFVGNHCKGSVFHNGIELATPALTDRIDRLARGLPQFHFGRIDVRFSTTAALARGDGFRVIEINGAGSEATHVWDPTTRLRDAWRAQFFHYGAAFRIGAVNRARGHRSAGIAAMWRHWRMQKRLMAAYPMND